eukprot:scaffold322984_cov15-Tisochrysis_lutea.AAC.1
MQAADRVVCFKYGPWTSCRRVSSLLVMLEADMIRYAILARPLDQLAVGQAIASAVLAANGCVAVLAADGFAAGLMAADG